MHLRSTVRHGCLLATLLAVACSGGTGDTNSVGNPNPGNPNPGNPNPGTGVSFETTTLPGGSINSPYQASITATGGQGAYAWSLAGGALPPGVVLDTAVVESTTTLSGTPTTAGVYQFTIDVGSGGTVASQTFSLEVSGGSAVLDGWTEFTVVPGARMIHVSSSSGIDSAPGTEKNPKRTLAAGYALLRDGQADWLLLRRGDTFPLQSQFSWEKTGPSSGSGMMRLCSYGDGNDPRPVIDSGNNNAFIISPGYRSARRIMNVAFTDLHIRASARIANPGAAVSDPFAFQCIAVEWQGSSGYPFSNLLLENMHIEGHSTGFSCSSDVQNLSMRRCIFHYLFRAAGNAMGAIGSPHGWLLEDNLFYRIQSSDIPGVAASSSSHSVYIGAGSTSVVARGNMCIKATGLMQRPGGIYSRGISAYGYMAGLMGQAWGVTPTAGGVQMTLEDSLFFNTRNNGPFFLGNTASGRVSNNVLVRDVDGPTSFDMQLIARNTTTSGVNIGVHNTQFLDNFLSGSITWNPQDTVSFSGLSFTNNRQGQGQVSTGIAAYLAYVGWSGTTIDDWAAAMLARDRDNFSSLHLSTSLINFYRSQIGLAELN